MSRFLRVVMIPVAALSLVGFPAPQGRRPNIVLISIDTLRADHVSSYGYKRQTTPSLDALASEGVRFDQVTAAANSTLPSHMSMFTSLYPEAHGVVDREESIRPQLSRNRTTLAQTLQKAGYETAAFVHDCTWLDPEFGFSRGFNSYSVLGTDAQKTNSEHVLPWLRQDHDAPFFLFVHYYDVHSDWTKLPYESPAPYDSRYTADYHGKFDGCGGGLCATRYILHLNEERAELPQADLEYIEGLYDNGIAFTDTQAGLLIDSLGDLGLREDTIVVVIADHGEELREHGCIGHCSLHEDTVRVPWIVSWPGHLEPQVVRTPVQSLDLMPTVLQLAGLPASKQAQGVSRVEEMLGRKGDPDRALFSTVAWGSEFSIRKGQWKLVLDSESDKRELYDLKADPMEATNLATKHPALTKELAARVEFFRTDNRHLLASAPPIGQGTLTVEDREKRESLGYAH